MRFILFDAFFVWCIFFWCFRQDDEDIWLFLKTCLLSWLAFTSTIAQQLWCQTVHILSVLCVHQSVCRVLMPSSVSSSIMSPNFSKFTSQSQNSDVTSCLPTTSAYQSWFANLSKVIRNKKRHAQWKESKKNMWIPSCYTSALHPKSPAPWKVPASSQSRSGEAVAVQKQCSRNELWSKKGTEPDRWQ